MPVTFSEGTGVPSWVSSAAFDLWPFCGWELSAEREKRVEGSVGEMGGKEPGASDEAAA